MAEAPRLKPRTVTEILDGSFRLYRENFFTFLGIMAVAYVPVIVLLVFLMGTVMAGVAGAAATPIDSGDQAAVVQAMTERLLPILGFYFFTIFLYMLAIQLATGALTRAVGARYLNEPASIGRAYGHVFRMFFKYLGTILLSGLVVGLGFMFCIVPGIIFAIWFAFTSSVCVLEGMGGVNAMGRSRELARGNAWRIIGLWLLTILANLVLGWAIGFFAEFVVPKMIEGVSTQVMVSQGIQQVFSMILQPLFSVAWILFYYDLRIRKEGFDLEVLAKAMSAPAGFFPGKSGPAPGA